MNVDNSLGNGQTAKFVLPAYNNRGLLSTSFAFTFLNYNVNLNRDGRNYNGR